MNDIFKLGNTEKLAGEKFKLNLKIWKPNQATFGTKSRSSCGSKAWSALTYHIKTSENLNSFEVIMMLILDEI